MVAQIPAASGAYMKQVNWLHLRAHDACNLSCPYCVMSARRGRVRADGMTAEQATEILRLLLVHSSEPQISVEISGGEPPSLREPLDGRRLRRSPRDGNAIRQAS